MRRQHAADRDRRVPAQGFTGRRLRVEIIGDYGTEWREGATVSFGDGVTVSSVDVAGPTDLLADLTVDLDAMPGKRDVTVTSGGAVTLTQAFELVPPVELKTQGNLGQGGTPYFTLVNHDPDNPFDTTWIRNTNEWPNIVVSGPEKIHFLVGNVTGYEVSGTAYIDLDATAGDLMITSGAGARAVTSNCGTFGAIPRAPTPITGPTTGLIAEAGDTQLYSIAAPGMLSLVHIRIYSAPFWFGASIFTGNQALPLVGSEAIVPGPATATFFVSDVTGGFGDRYTLSAFGEMLTTAPEGDDATNDTISGALAATALPFEQTGGTLSSKSDVDVISFTITAANANRRVVLIAASERSGGPHPYPDPNVDYGTGTAVDITDAAGTTSYLSIYGGGPVDGPHGVEVLSDPLPEGAYYVKISAGAQYSTSEQAYAALIYIW